MTTEEETRLNEEIELADFNHCIQLQEARQQVCESAVEWYRIEEEHRSAVLDLTRIKDGWKAIHRVHEAAKRLAELEEQ